MDFMSYVCRDWAVVGFFNVNKSIRTSRSTLINGSDSVETPTIMFTYDSERESQSSVEIFPKSYLPHISKIKNSIIIVLLNREVFYEMLRKSK